MTQYRRLLLPGATYFFTVRLKIKGATLLTDHIETLRWAYARTVREYPVTCHAMVILPDHLHAVWTEPDSGVWYCERWKRIKARFSHAIPDAAAMRPSLEGKPDRGIWQRRFDEHAIQTEEQFSRALAHCAQNPVKHGLVTDATLWPFSSFAKARMGHMTHLAMQAARPLQHDHRMSA